ncbi:MAG TPA: cytochrome c3 family protein [Candidatus Methanoperedens sp.]|nr:cytochrome c3 family protein [Candidatus Methanoperedens sp.]
MLQKNVSKIIIGIVFVLMLLQITQPAASKAPDILNNSCADCHSKFLFSSETQRQFVDIRIKHLESGISCSIVCHEDKLNKSTASTYALWSISTHALFEVTCEKCHGGDPTKVLKQDAHVGISNISIQRANTPEMCGKCHTSELDEFKSSQHFKRLESNQEELPAPACITCHQAHSVRVLTASEIEDFCSNCHNNITGINPSVPKKAEAALSSVKELQFEISRARSSVLAAKAMEKDVTAAQADLESASLILKNTPSVWHRFNLTYFDTEVQKGINDARNAEKAMPEGTAQPAPTKAPGFELLLLLSGLLAAYLLKRH